MLGKSSVACITGIIEPSQLFFSEPRKEQDASAKLRNNISLGSMTPAMQAKCSVEISAPLE